MLRLLSMLSLLLGLAACPPPADDDDASASDDDDATTDDDDVTPDDDDVTEDDDDSADDDDDDATACSLELSGAVIAVDRQSGQVLSDDEYAERVGGLIVYILPDVSNLAVIYDKVTMEGPGSWSLTLDSCPATFEVGAVVDADDDHIIMSLDIAREHAFNPILVAGDGEPIEGLDIIVDIARPHGSDDGGGGDDDDASGGDDDDASGGDDDDGGGDDDDGGGGDDDDDASGGDDDDASGGDDDDSVGPSCPATFDGDVVVNGYPAEAVAVTANTEDMSVGPHAYVILDEPGDFTLDVPCFGDMTSFLGILDVDGNTYFEPSDPQGVSEDNPWILGLGPTSGVHIPIPAAVAVPYPEPEPYIGVTGTVAYDAFTTGDIIVSATLSHPGGLLFSRQTLAAPGAFSLIVPPGTENVLVWAVLDDDGDGAFDVFVNPYDSHGPVDVENGISGISLVLAEDPPMPGSLAGTVNWPGAVSGADCQRVGLFGSEPVGPAVVPLDVQVSFGPTFPVPFFFDDLVPGPYWIAGYLDVDCNNDVGGAGPEDPEGRTEFPVLVGDGQDVTGVSVLMEE